MADEPRRLTAPLIHPDTKKPYPVPLKRFTPAAYEEFMDVGIDFEATADENREAEERIKSDPDMEPAERRERIKELRKRQVRQLLWQKFAHLRAAADIDAVRVEDFRRFLEIDLALLAADPDELQSAQLADRQELDRFIMAQDFEGIDKALHSFRRLLGLP